MANRKRKKKRGTLRVDRVAILLIVVIGIPVFISTLLKSCSSEEPSTSEVITQQENTVTNPLNSYEEAIERLGFQKITVSANEIHQGSLILVNNEHEYTFPATQSNSLISENKNDYYKVLNSNMSLNIDTIENLNQLMQQYYNQNADGSITISSAYRNKAEQDIIYNQAMDNDVAENQAGFSEHHTGYAFDLFATPKDQDTVSFSDYTNSSWIVENCAKYGFIQRYPSDKKNTTGLDNPSHFRYVSVPHSQYITEKNICFEEYISILNDYKFGSKALRFSYNDKEYMVYICESNGSDTIDVYVPKDKNYTISGNNINAIIVTVEV